MKRPTLLWISGMAVTGMAVAAVLSGCAWGPTSTLQSSQPSDAMWPPVVAPNTPGSVYELPDPGFDGYDPRAVWLMCEREMSLEYPQLAPEGDYDYQDFYLDSVSMPGSAPADFGVRIPMSIRGTSKQGTMICSVAGGPASPFVVSFTPYRF